MTGPDDAARHETLRRYVDGTIAAEHAADLLGPRTSVADVILEATRVLHRLPDRRDAFTRGEYRRACALLDLPASPSFS